MNWGKKITQRRYKKFSAVYATPAKKAFALKLRNNPTPAEAILWKRLVSRQVKNNVFVRQKVILGWIVDFYSSHSRVVIELDGNTHDPKKDHIRDVTMNNEGIYVLRFKNEDVFNRIDWVIDRISESLRIYD